MKIKLTKEESNYLLNASFLSSEEKKIFSISDKNMVINDDFADNIREKCGDELQVIGFDEKYSLTKFGKILESLIDKLYIG